MSQHPGDAIQHRVVERLAELRRAGAVGRGERGRDVATGDTRRGHQAGPGTASVASVPPPNSA